MMMIKTIQLLLALMATTHAFVSSPVCSKQSRLSSLLFTSSSSDVGAAPSISGEELETMMTEWDTPLVIDVYATGSGPCVKIAPEFEAAAENLKGKVRMVKLNMDKNKEMAARFGIQGLPTLLFLDKPDGEDRPNAPAALKGKIGGFMRRENIENCCEYYFFRRPSRVAKAMAKDPYYFFKRRSPRWQEWVAYQERRGGEDPDK